MLALIRTFTPTKNEIEDAKSDLVKFGAWCHWHRVEKPKDPPCIMGRLVDFGANQPTKSGYWEPIVLNEGTPNHILQTHRVIFLMGSESYEILWTEYAKVRPNRKYEQKTIQGHKLIGIDTQEYQSRLNKAIRKYAYYQDTPLQNVEIRRPLLRITA